ncbi:MAG: DegV family protein [Oscillospiraceae bacterium]|nr:DegV family protein [Oscillospiraceae bacterium]
MATYQIITDSACDLPKAMLQQLQVSNIPLHILFRGENMIDSVDEGLQEIYAGLRNGEATSTSAINPDGWASVIEPALAQGNDALVLAFSSGLSTTYQSAVIAAEELREKYPERNIRVVDTLCAALGQGLLVWYTCKQRDAGLTLDELTDWVEQNKLSLCHWVTVNDLMHLKRGGRISATTAVVGTMLQIKPIIHVNDEGKLISVGKARGRKAAMQILVDKMKQLGQGYDNSTVFITHGDCLEDGQLLKQMVLEQTDAKEVFLGNLGAVIGSHAGPGTLALFFLGKHR